MKTTCDNTSTREKETCGCMDVGTILDNADCIATYSKQFATKEEALAAQESLTAKARGIESEPCQISADLAQAGDVYQLDMSFVFSCQAETLIFQLGTR
ncbi:YfcZ/YiiS family protein [Mangrovibacter yixingensis]|uniref:YfcZ/YiiS family protein n=1 Tax=Mangrovibacter yixingensis TaxID=1529639 RepID=UPI001CF9A22F|nr:YfcZ/YiiS family protein [Mangrovibacter yixingensis]